MMVIYTHWGGGYSQLCSRHIHGILARAMREIPEPNTSYWLVPGTVSPEDYDGIHYYEEGGND